jgi:pimeloyl-ACP methyl ester carboxylesterase
MQFADFINSEQMATLKSRIVWIHVNLPGQEPDAPDLHVKKYPSLEQLGEEIVCVLNHLNVPHVVCVGQGVGANIAIHFSVKHPTRCLGLVVIEPVGSSASLFQSFKFKLMQRRRTISNNEAMSFSPPNARLFQRRRTLSFSSEKQPGTPKIDEEVT